MIKLKDLLEVMYNVTEMEINARNPDTRLLHTFYFSQDDFGDLPPGVRDRILMGQTMFIQDRINVHGKATRGGAEMAFGVEMKAIPKEFLDAEVFHFLDFTRREGLHLSVDVIMQELQCETARANLQKRAWNNEADDTE